jgi:hypothetical protein
MHPEITCRLAAARQHELASEASAARDARLAAGLAPPQDARTWRRPAWLRVPRLRTGNRTAVTGRHITPAA